MQFSLEPNQAFCLRMMLTLLHFLWQGCALALLAAFAGFLLRRRTADLRYWVHVAVLGLMIFAPVGTFIWLGPPQSQPQRKTVFMMKGEVPPDLDDFRLQMTTPESMSSEDALPSAWTPSPPSGSKIHPAFTDRLNRGIHVLPLRSFAPWVVVIYFCGLLLMMLRLTLALSSGRGLRQLGRPVDDPLLLAAFERATRVMDFAVAPCIAWCECVAVPCIVGLLKPTILLPLALAAGCSTRQMEALLLHELAHLRRHDPWVHIVQWITETLLFFHPAVWWLSRRIRFERELACDDMVLSAGISHECYAESLLRMAELSQSAQAARLAALALASDGRDWSGFGKRVMRLIDPQSRHEKICLRRAWPIGALMALLIIGSCALTFRASEPERKNIQANGADKKDKIADAPSEVKSPKKIPNGPDAKTEKDFRAMWCAWCTRLTLDAYEKAGHRNPAWDEEAKTFLNDAIKHATSISKSLSTKSMWQEMKNFQPKGCDDGMVLYWSSEIARECGALDQARILLDKAAAAIKSGDYPKIYSFYVDCSYWELEQRKPKIKRDNEDLYANEALKSLADAVEGNEYQGEEIRICYVQLRRLDEWQNEKSREILISLLQKRSNVDPWLLNVLKGEAEINQAWMARGGGWTYTVAENSWPEFQNHLVKARDALQAAWKLAPHRPEAPAAMITVAMADSLVGEENDRMWFDRAVAAQMDYWPAYRRMLGALRPSWIGSQEQMEAFGVECLQNARFDTSIPLYYLKALRDIGSELPDDNWRQVFRRPGVHDKIQHLTDGMLKDPAQTANRQNLTILKGIVEGWCGDYEAAKKTLADIDRKTNLNRAWKELALDWNSYGGWQQVDGQNKAFTGTQKAILTEAESEQAKSNVDQAATLYERALKASNSDKEIQAYMRERIKAMLKDRDLKQNEAQSAMQWNDLHTAVQNKQVETTRKLLKDGADVNAGADHGFAPLISAVSNGDLEMARLLLAHDAQIDIKNVNGQPVLVTALAAEQHEMANLLIEHGANIHRAGEGGWTPLVNAIQVDYQDTVKLLLERNSDVNATNDYHWTPLMIALNLPDPMLAQILLDHGAKINGANDEGWTPLHFAVFRRLLPLTKSLLDQGADTEAVTDIGETPLQKAVRLNYPEIAMELMRHGANIHVGPQGGFTLLYHAVSNRDNPEVAMYLIDHGVDLNAPSRDGWTALHVAAAQNSVEIARRLLAQGARIDPLLNTRQAPLYVAIEAKNLEMIKLLVEHGADINIININGRTPLTKAVQMQRPDIVKLLSPTSATLQPNSVQTGKL